MDIKKVFLFFIFVLLMFFVFTDNFTVNPFNPAASVYKEGLNLQRNDEYELSEQKFIEALKISPDFVPAKDGLILSYKNLIKKYYDNKNYAKSVSYARKLAIYAPDDYDNYKIIAECYFNLKSYEKAVKYYKRVLFYKPDDTGTMRSIAQIYVDTQQYEIALKTCKKILILEPNDEQMRKNIDYLKSKVEDHHINQEIDNLTVKKEAPYQLYKLIKTNLSPKILAEVQGILDLVWNEPNGRIMLTTIWQNQIPINIIERDEIAYTRDIVTTKNGDTYSTHRVESVNIPVKYIYNFNDSNHSAMYRIDNLNAFMHEFGHAFFRIKNPQTDDSMEEELGVTMIGYNIAYKIITGEYLNQEKTKEISINAMEGLLSDDHRNLPVYNGFNNKIQSYGIVMPYLVEYSDVVSMYKKLRSENKTTPVPNLERY